MTCKSVIDGCDERSNSLIMVVGHMLKQQATRISVVRVFFISNSQRCGTVLQMVNNVSKGKVVQRNIC